MNVHVPCISAWFKEHWLTFLGLFSTGKKSLLKPTAFCVFGSDFSTVLWEAAFGSSWYDL